MSDFHHKKENEKGQHHLHLHESRHPPAHSHMTVKSILNHNLNLKMSQLPTRATNRISNIWRYPATVNYSSALNGGQLTIPVIRSTGSGHAIECAIRLVITNSTGGGVRLVDIPHLIDYIEWRNGAGSQIQQMTGDELYLNICRFYDDESFKKIS